MRRLRCFYLCVTGFEKLPTQYRPRGSVIACRPCVIIVLRGTLARMPPNICDLASVLPVVCLHCHAASNEIDMDFHQLRGETDTLLQS